MSDDHFLSRWSRLKRASREAPTAEAPATAKARAESPSAAQVPAQSAATPAKAEPPPLPPVDSLTPDSDFTGFMRDGVDPSLRRQALKTLFQDPRFNVMDGLDVYIDDYSKPDPLPEGWLEKLNQTARLGEYREPEEKQPQPAIPDDIAGEPVAAENSQAEQRVDAAAGAPARAPAEPHAEDTNPGPPPR